MILDLTVFRIWINSKGGNDLADSGISKSHQSSAIAIEDQGAVPLYFGLLKIIGGVEDTRLEAKDTKKNPRPMTALPRTDPLEAKDRNARGQGQGPRTQVRVFSN